MKGSAFSLLLCLSGLTLIAAPETAPNFFRAPSIHEIQIELSDKALANLRTKPRRDVHAKVTMDGRTWEEVEVHLKGSVGSFRPIDDKPSFTLDLGKTGATQTAQTFQKIHLNNSVEDPSYLNEQLGTELFLAAGIPAPEVGHAHVQLNRHPLGLYVLKEGFDPQFLGRYFERGDGNLYDTDSGHDLDEPMKRHQGVENDDLKRVAAAAKEANSQTRWQALSAAVDLEEFVKFIAVEVMICHRDGYALAKNNFRIYHDSKSDKIFFLPAGMDQLFGNARLPWKPQMAGLLAKSVMETPEGQTLYRRSFTNFFSSLLQTQRLVFRVDKMVSDLRPLLTGAELRQIEGEAGTLKARIIARARNLQRQLTTPEPALARFEGGITRPIEWSTVDSPAGGLMNESKTPGATSALHIAAGPATSASWRNTLLLPKGRYRFEGRVMTHGVKPLPFGKVQGAGLRVGGEALSNGLLGDNDWTDFAIPFEVRDAESSIELICELRASAGEAWFDKQSLRVISTK